MHIVSVRASVESYGYGDTPEISKIKFLYALDKSTLLVQLNTPVHSVYV